MFILLNSNQSLTDTLPTPAYSIPVSDTGQELFIYNSASIGQLAIVAMLFLVFVTLWVIFIAERRRGN